MVLGSWGPGVLVTFVELLFLIVALGNKERYVNDDFTATGRRPQAVSL